MLFDYLPLLAGIGMFLFGMSLMGDSLEKIAGSNLEKTLEKLTNSKAKGVLLGTAVTGIIQSSAATTVMVVGFLNAGIIKLYQAVPVIMGANIGTTVTGQLLRLGDINGASLVLTLLKPSTFAPILIGIGAFIHLLTKSKKAKNISLLLIGLGLLFFGMSTMEKTLSPLKDIPSFQNLFVMFTNPFLGILVGAVVTAAIQSSSASVGILQALASTGAVSFSAAAPIIMGQNIGTCVTVMLASVGANKNAKRAVFFHLSFNIIGTIIFITAIYLYQGIVGFSFWDAPVDRGSIADFHTLFNVVNTILLLPFTGKIISLSKKFIPDSGYSKAEESIQLLDNLLLNRPAVALNQSFKSVSNMGDMAEDNLRTSVALLYHFNESDFTAMNEIEDVMDRAETAINNYIIKITSTHLTDKESEFATSILQCVGNFERMGDHAMNIAEVAENNKQSNVDFSKEAILELYSITQAVKEITTLTVNSFKNQNSRDAGLVEPLEEVIDAMIATLKEKHIDRLSTGKCNVPAGISFLEILTNLERISDHCSNVATYTMQMTDESGTFNSRAYITRMHMDPPEQFKRQYAMYEAKYLTPLLNNTHTNNPNYTDHKDYRPE